MTKLGYCLMACVFVLFMSVGVMVLPANGEGSWPSVDFGNQQYRIRIHKLSHTLELFQKGEIQSVRTYPIATAVNSGDKQRPGDCRTPISWGDVEEGLAERWVPSATVPFVVEAIYDASDWTHDFGDGKGEIAGAYGPWFISLSTGWDGIGIHGTHDPDSIGTNASEGCIRMYNQDVAELKELICQDNNGVGINVVITDD